MLILLIVTYGCMAKPAEDIGKLAELYGVRVESKLMSILVDSNGCTQKGSFKLSWHGKKLFIKRVKSDNCKRLPRRIWLNYPIPETIQKFSLMNPISN